MRWCLDTAFPSHMPTVVAEANERTNAVSIGMHSSALEKNDTSGQCPTAPIRLGSKVGNEDFVVEDELIPSAKANSLFQMESKDG